MLSVEERNDLRRRVLAGEDLTVEQAREVIASIRQNQGVAVLAGEHKSSGRRKGSGKAAMSDEALDQDLKDLGAL